MDGQVYYEDNNTNCINISYSLIKQFQNIRIFGIISIPLLLVPTLILQLIFIYRYKSTFLHRQFFYTTVVVILLVTTYAVYSSSLNVGCPLFFLFVNSLNVYLLYVDMMQMLTIHLLLLYKLCKYMQRLQALCCNIRPRLWHEVIIVCIQFGLPLPILIVKIVVILKTHHFVYFRYVEVYFRIPLVAVNILLGLICIVLLMIWFCMLTKRNLLQNKVKFVCTQISHILFVLVVLLIGNTAYFYPENDYYLVVFSALREFAPVSFGVYFLISLPTLQRKVTTVTVTKVIATNRHTNPPSTRVSLPTDTAEHAPNFLSPSTDEPSQVTPLVNKKDIML